MYKFMIQAQLASCPFCKCEYPVVKHEWVDFHMLIWIECPKCRCRTMKYFGCSDSINTLISLWNNSGEKIKASKGILFFISFLPFIVAKTLKNFFERIEKYIKRSLTGGYDA